MKKANVITGCVLVQALADDLSHGLGRGQRLAAEQGQGLQQGDRGPDRGRGLWPG